jgi:hypothetical protein
LGTDVFHLSNGFHKATLVDIKDIFIPFLGRPDVFLIVIGGENEDLKLGISILGCPELLNDRSAGMLSNPGRADDEHLSHF